MTGARRCAAPALAVVGALGLAACSGKWPASMEQQPSLQPLSEARPAPVGSIPLGGLATLDERDDAVDLTSPYPLDAAAEQRGAKVFAIHCVACHGPEARGDGLVSAKFPPAPNLRHISICKRSDGYLYGTVTAGGRAMPTMRDGTSVRDRWDLVAFVRSLQREGCTGEMATPGTATGEPARSTHAEPAPARTHGPPGEPPSRTGAS